MNENSHAGFIVERQWSIMKAAFFMEIYISFFYFYIFKNIDFNIKVKSSLII